ncbi:hypothetical protein [Citrobacter sp. Res13-Sevr-PEB04-36]|uniref:hypothetical protein n=1 Tax=Citrobacter sp. Res13-Sevr-PEB04-36 TaxID=2777960 RepID=UPI0018ACCEA8|nr:hypothetical protein [Citrobacter sp. Res13-Sevr-PEB04-36]
MAKPWEKYQGATAVDEADTGSSTEPWLKYQQAQAQPESPQPQSQQGSDSLDSSMIGALKAAGRSIGEDFPGAAEQAARGIANIPADLAQGGVNILNTVGKAAAWANGVLGVNDGGFTPIQDVYRPIDQPIDPYAKIGEEIGNYLIPGAGPVGGAMIGSVANAGNQPGDFAENATKEMAINTALMGIPSLYRGAKALIGRGAEAAPISAATSAIDEGAGAATAAKEAIPTPGVQETAAKVGEAAQSGKPSRIADVVNDIQPKQDVIDATKNLGLDPDDMLEAYTSGNDAFKAVQMGLASQDESVLAAVKRDSIKRISERASKIIDDAGAMPDRLAMDDKFKTGFETTRRALKAKEKELFTPINNAISPRTPVESVNTKSMLDDMADDVGGYQYLSPVEKEVYEAISPTTDKAGPLTYRRLRNMMSMVGAELEKAGTPFGSTKERNLSALYSTLSKDRDAVAISHGLSDQLKAANAVTAQRKMMEKRVYNLIGKDLTGDVTVKAKSALDGLYSGNTKPFVQLMRSMPDKDMRSQLIATGMRDMLRKGSRSDLADNINGLVDFYGELKRKGTIRLLEKELPAQTMRELNDFYKLGREVKATNRFHIPNGKLNGFLKKLDQPGGFIDQLSRHGKMAIIATALGHVPVVGPILNTSVAAHMGAKEAIRKTGADAAQELMTSPVWKDMVSAAKRRPSAEAQEKIAAHFEKRIAAIPAWKEFYRSLPAEQKERIARAGIIGWLSGEAEEGGN